MQKTELTASVDAAKSETRNSLQTIYNTMNQGQKKQVVKDESVKALFDRYGVEYHE